ncbi:UDP-glucose 4-epimerase GalE (plasmid) [Ruegeria sp. SCSIO 43209]|uniref:UDP-glucose 4-epimerase GalE n=1 Tax=Ruegeria sp. SCSIO 43209 TaxID=2793010 RepID=UPI0014801E36|nr:UDP-glucose 4-epimerase GalE [Ruegeria sp. SCSIO 43209]UAB91750.1 UDP-glucose 4-epimerase GalE [Ruegeria sp. SCSIO 43209]
MRVLLTGGAGYIGSHTLLKLLQDGIDVLALDNFSNSSPEVLRRVQKLTNSSFATHVGDYRAPDVLDEVFEKFRPDAVIHFAGLKAVGESNEKPLTYYAQNVSGSINLLDCMQRHGCQNIVFSSSATVYGEAQYLPYDEDHPLNPTNPYGRTKYFIEEIIRDWIASRPHASAVLLRYFNPVGADESGNIGEDPRAIPNNLLPYISQVAVGRLKELSIFGNNYETRDGTGERDYIHIDDLAAAHLAAVKYAHENHGCEAINVGTGTGITVLEMVKAFEEASGREIPFKIAERRQGDVARSFAEVSKAQRLLDWTAKRDLTDICRTAWNWQSKNPSGFEH